MTTTQQKLKNLEKLIEKKPSTFLERFNTLKRDRKWLGYSSAIASHVLESLKEKEWTQKKLADELLVSPQQINKIVKGRENLTLETISKLETVLNIQLIETTNFQTVRNFQTLVSELELPRKSIQGIPVSKMYQYKGIGQKNKNKQTVSSKSGYTKFEYAESKESCQILPNAA